MPILKALTVVALLLVALLAPGCGGPSSGGSSEKKVTLTLWNTMGPLETEGLIEVLRAFAEKKPHITVQVENVSFLGGRSRFETAMKAGVGPDLFRADRFWIPLFVKAGQLQELDQTLFDEELKDLVPLVREVGRVGEKVFGIPQKVDCLALLCNKAHFDEAKALPPETFDQFRDTASKLTSSQKGRYGFFMVPDGWWFEPFLYGFGGTYFDGDKLSFHGEPALKATHFLIDLKETLKALPPVNLRTSSYDVMMTSFRNGQVSMIINGPWAIREAFAGTVFKDNTANLMVAPLPKGPAGFYTPVGCQAWVIPSSCKNRKETVELLKFLSSVEAMAIICKKNYSIPARQSLFNDPELRKDPFLAPFLRQMQECRAHPDDHADRGELYTLIGEYLVKVLSGDVTPEDGLKDLAAGWKGKK